MCETYVNYLITYDDIDTTTLFADQVNSCGPRRKLSTAESAASSELFGQRGESWWTGCPLAQVPGMRPDGRLSSIPQLLLTNCTKQVGRDCMHTFSRRSECHQYQIMVAITENIIINLTDVNVHFTDRRQCNINGRTADG